MPRGITLPRAVAAFIGVKPVDAPKWSVVVPVKGGVNGKSRLGEVAGDQREELAIALALDTLAAVAATPRVRLVVVTPDPVVAAEARRLGALVVADTGDSLSAALAAGVRAAVEDERRGPEPGVAILLGDLPALRPHDLQVALEACFRARTAFVPDAQGRGSVLLASIDPAHLQPAFGPESAVLHAATAARLDLDLPRLRRDVDLADDLAQAVALGVGARTRALLEGSPKLAAEISAQSPPQGLSA